MAGTERRPDVRHEPRDAEPRPVLLFGVWLAVACLAAAAAMFGLLKWLTRGGAAGRQPSAAVSVSLHRLPPEPRLEPAPLLPIARLREEEKERLTTYGWVDEKTGVVHIPIDRAMDAVVRNGLPRFPVPGPPGRDTAAAQSVLKVEGAVRR
ncbi:MAG TPA: hypothetical protein VIA45_11545 [Thermoanaerobaculia bacterium]|jgi:hypothetical protein